MATYSAADIIGKTLIAKRPINLVRFANDNAPIVYVVDAGQSVGKVFSYLPSGPNRSVLYWQFEDDNKRPYFAAHHQGDYDIKALSEQGALTLQEQQEQAQEEAMTTGDKIFRLITNIAIYGGLIYLAKSYIDKK